MVHNTKAPAVPQLPVHGSLELHDVVLLVLRADGQAVEAAPVHHVALPQHLHRAVVILCQLYVCIEVGEPACSSRCRTEGRGAAAQ